MTEARAWAIFDDSLKTGPFRFTRRPCGPGDVKIDIKFCGICSSDMHIARNGWKDVLATRYPVVPGHEIVGHVTEVGAAVKKFKIGDSVGVGCLVDSCRTCDGCTSGLEQMCLQQTLTYNGVEKDGVTPTRGGYSDHIVVREEFVVRIPENLSLAAAAPLLCAGITMFSPLRHWKVVAGDHVGVVGLGGLGSMGVKLAKAMGAKVTVFTTSASKVALAKEIGADDVVISSDATAMGAVKDLKVIIDTASHAHDLNPYIGTLARDGTLVIVGAPETPNPPIQVFGLIMGRRSVAGSPIGGIGETQEMLDFCGKHNIVSDIELIPIQRINDAYDRLLKNDCKGRFVIDNSSLQNE